MKMTKIVLLACGLALVGVSGAFAQGPDEPARFFVNVGGGLQVAGRTISEGGSFSLYDEDGSFTGERKTENAPFFDIGGGAHLSGKWSAGVAVSRLVKSTNVPFTVIAPHPLFVNSPRTVALNVNDLGHRETAIHLHALWQLFSNGRYDVSVFAGPSVVNVKEDFVEAVTATESGSPYTAVSLNATFGTASKTTFGGNAGIDSNYRISGGIGAGLYVRYVVGSVKLAGAGGATHTVKLGGPQVGIGLRYRF